MRRTSLVVLAVLTLLMVVFAVPATADDHWRGDGRGEHDGNKWWDHDDDDRDKWWDHDNDDRFRGHHDNNWRDHGYYNWWPQCGWYWSWKWGWLFWCWSPWYGWYLW